MWHTFQTLLKTRFGLVLLGILVAIIAVATLKPNFYVIGWDTFPSFFNPATNIFRTFFATWRGYRGLGVASDSESVDLFRQIMSLVLSPVLPQTLLDQVYMVMSLGIGIIAMYFLAWKLLKKARPDFSDQLADLFGLFAGIFYLFNLNTVSTFTFPMIMYITRYASIPLIFLAFFSLLNTPKVGWKHFLAIIVGVFYISGSYITGTIFITLCISLFLFGITQKNPKRFIVIFLIYLGLNAFWLFPFLNYTMQKAQLIRLAPTFVNANEVQLNKPKSFYSLRKQLLFYPNFFDTTYTDIESGQKLQFHRLATEYNYFIPQIFLLLFPALYLIGAFFILIHFRVYRQLLFAPFILFTFLFLSLKEFSPLGFVYSFLNSVTPYFGVLFRFGDTKFHVFSVFAGSLAAAFALIILIDRIKQIPARTLMFLILIPYLILFRDYFSGRFIGTFIYNKIPSAYFDITKTINDDPSMFRVLHIPFDNETYWKSYSWGVVGSSFLHFMLDKPFIDRTFEPASQENANLHKKINDLLANAQSLQKNEDRAERARQFVTLIRKVGIKYIIFDDTIKTGIYPKGFELWGRYNNADSRAMMTYLKDYGYVDGEKKYDLNLLDYADFYKADYPLSNKKKDLLSKNSTTTINLIKMKDVQEKVTFLESATFIEPDLKNVLGTDMVTSNERVIQDLDKSQTTFFPFKRRNATVVDRGDVLEMQFDDRLSATTHLTLHIPKNTKIAAADITNFIDIFIEKRGGDIVVSFFLRKSPDIAGNVVNQKIKEIIVPKAKLDSLPVYTNNLTNYISDWNALPTKELTAFRLVVGNLVVPITAFTLDRPQFVATITIKGGTMPVQFLAFDKRVAADPQIFAPTDNPNCFYDKLEDSASRLTTTSSLIILSRNQSTCAFYDLKTLLQKPVPHIEIGLKIVGRSQDQDAKYGLSYTQTAKPNLKKFVTSLPKPNALRFCVKPSQVDTCYNLHQFVNIDGDQTVTFPLERALNGLQDAVILLSAKNTGYQSQSLLIRDVTVDEFKTLQSDELTFSPNEEIIAPILLSKETPFVVTVPKALAVESYFADPVREGFNIANKSCEDKGGYRTFRIYNGKLLSYFENCYTSFFQTNDFSPNAFYLWTLNYNLMSGKFPHVIVDDKFYSYINEYLSFDQGYPDVPGFKQFQNPELLFSPYNSKGFQKAFNNLTYQRAYGFIYPTGEVGDEKQIQFAIQQDSENEGVMLVDAMIIQSLPSQWADMRITAGASQEKYQKPQVKKTKYILPSLYSVEVSGMEKGNSLMLFNEAYDAQWRLYDSPWGVLLNFLGGQSPARCDGYANCFVIKPQSKSATTLYLFYTPERLYILGWFTTILVIVAASRIFMKKRRVAEEYGASGGVSELIETQSN